MKIYLVGGAVRDMVMGIEPKDKDYVVVGSTPEEMLSLGYKQVGADFPVFLHPETGEEYALARTERKVAAGYHGFETIFTSDITIEEDLMRRDLTINSMAWIESTGTLIDPYGGKRDIENRILRHTSNAFREDPVRILRVARFAARFGFSVANSTYELMRDMVESGEFNHLTAERVWKELERAFMEKHFWKVWIVLASCDAIKMLEMLEQMDYDSFESAADANESLLIRCAAGMQFESKQTFDENRIPSEISDLALTANKIQKFCNDARKNHGFSKNSLLDMFMSVDLFRRPERFESALKVLKHRNVCVGEVVVDWAQRVRAVDCGAIALSCIDKKDILVKIREARLEAMRLGV